MFPLPAKNLRSILLGLVILSAWTSGCLGQDDDGGPAAASDTTGTADSTAGTTPTDSTAPSGSGSAPENHPPTAEIEMSVVDEANHTYVFDGSRSSDPEGGDLTFSWDFGDNTTGSNVTETHTFETGNQSGNLTFIVTLVVTDDAALMGHANTTVTFMAGPASGSPHHTESIAEDGLLLVGTATEPMLEDVDYADHVVTIVDTGEDGVAILATEARINLTAGGGAIDLDLYFLDPEGEELASSATEEADESLTHSKPMPPGEYTIRVYFWAGAAGSYDVTADIDYVVA